MVLGASGSSLASAVLHRAKRVWLAQGNTLASKDLDELLPEGAIAGAPEVSVRVTDMIASALNLAYNPRLLGRELIDAAEALECTDDIALLERNIKSRPLSVNNDDWVLSLGDLDGRKYALRSKAPTDPTRALLLKSIYDIGRAAMELERRRGEERRRAALWPAEPLEDNQDALFVAEEMQALLAVARRVAATAVPVLITGETGTGKEILARTIHACSTRARRPFLPFNCGSTPRDMLDSQLFGHRRGAFTGATENFQGVIRAASEGTLFLDEIGDMGLDVQPKLLRFLESGEIHPIGEAQPVRVDVRVIAATNAPLDTLVAEGRFREDLFYRLNIVRLHVPPLRERRVEIPALAAHYLAKHAAEFAKGDLRLAEETMEYLVLYRWPGNVRQLANEMRRLAALAESGAVLMPEHLSAVIASSRRTIPASERVLEPTEVVVRLDQPMAAGIQHLERAMMQYALRRCGGRLEETAAMLGLSRKGLYLKRQRFGIEMEGPAAADV